MSTPTFEQLLEAGCHFGHLKRKWNPAMAPYIFMERNGIHIIDLYKTAAKLEEAAAALKNIAKSGKKVLFVATKKQAKQVLADKASSINMPYVIERWPGGMLTNFPTIRKAVKKMANIDKMTKDGTFDNLSKRERLQITRQRAKLEKNLGSIADLNRLPSALFVVDVMKEHIAVAEANRLGIPVFGMVDTNSNPDNIDFVIPCNDDASKSIEIVLDTVCSAMAEGLEERKAEKADAPAEGAQRVSESRQGEGPNKEDDDYDDDFITPDSRKRRKLYLKIGFVLLVLLVVFFVLRAMFFVPVVSEGAVRGYVVSFEKTGVVFDSYEGELVVDTPSDTALVRFSTTVQETGKAIFRMMQTDSVLVLKYKKYKKALPWRGNSPMVVTDVKSVARTSVSIGKPEIRKKADGKGK